MEEGFYLPEVTRVQTTSLLVIISSTEGKKNSLSSIQHKDYKEKQK
jgi:hypothetical protein